MNLDNLIGLKLCPQLEFIKIFLIRSIPPKWNPQNKLQIAIFAPIALNLSDLYIYIYSRCGLRVL